MLIILFSEKLLVSYLNIWLAKFDIGIIMAVIRFVYTFIYVYGQTNDSKEDFINERKKVQKFCQITVKSLLIIQISWR